ncbi:spindle pole body component alp4 protein [Rutstroemia sp. NJR-2017a WRK4]|nr:spindle pole body component alp4 protein [Rutstroemia sp. NJR-2017a WRK4]
MSSAHARASSQSERRPATENGSRSRPPSVAQFARAERADARRRASPTPTDTESTHRRNTSTSQRNNRGVEERRTERTQITTRETVTSRTRSPDRRTERSRPSETSRARPEEPQPKVSKTETQPLPWNPQASLIPHTTAPLACRVSIPPLALQAPVALQPTPLYELSLEVQEAAILEDLLFIFMGYEGQYIRFGKNYDPHQEKDRLAGPSFKILAGLDPSLQDLTTTMLKMATHYGATEAFVEVQSREEFGAVNHALCAAIRKLLQDYLILIAQLETQFLTNPSFTLHVLNLHVLPTSHMMFQLYSLAHEILKRNSMLEEDEEDDGGMDDFENILESLREGGDLGLGNIPGKKICKGGSVLGLITKRLETMSGDPAARSLLTSLLRDASRPYMVMLNEWLHHGSIKDPHSEFLVREQKSIKRERLEEDYTDEYWERRYTIRDTDVPPQLEGVKDKVLLAGKYLNVVRECGGVDVSKEVKDVPRSFDDNRFLENVNNAYAHANESLLKLLLTSHALPARLRSLKHYFFLDRSDFFSYFLELGNSELRKPLKVVNTSKLQSLLDLVLRQPGSVAAQDPFKEDIKVEMNDISLTNMLTRVVNISGIEQGESLQTPAQPIAENDKAAVGFTSLQLDYSVPFPVSLVISRKTVWRYQALFRYLLSLRYLEQQLVACWQTHNRAATWSHRSSNRNLEMWKRRVFTLRARMLVFVQQLLYFCTSEVIEPNWQGLMARLNGKDEGKSGKSAAIHSKLMSTCTMFATFTSWLSRELEKIDQDLLGTEKPTSMNAQQWKRFQLEKATRNAESNSGNASADGAFDEARLEKMYEIIRKYEFNFSKHLQILLDALNHYAATETVVLLGLCARLSTANQGTQFNGLRTDEDGAAQ